MCINECLWKLSRQRVDCANYQFRASQLQIFACSVKVNLGPLDFSLPAAIETLSEGAGDMVQEERALPSSSSVLT